MEAMEACGHKESRAINAVSNCEGGLVIFYGLKEGEVEAQEDSQG